jgi:hypothetical protein
MEDREREYKKFKFGLALKRLMEDGISKKTINPGQKSLSGIISYRELESASGIRHASIVEIVNGQKNASWTTIDAILEGLGINLTQFGSVYDKITHAEVLAYKQEIEKKKREREKKKLGKTSTSKRSPKNKG